LISFPITRYPFPPRCHIRIVVQFPSHEKPIASTGRHGLLGETRPRCAGGREVFSTPPICSAATSRSPGPIERKLMITALNFRRRRVQGRLRDSLSPTCDAVVTGQATSPIEAGGGARSPRPRAMRTRETEESHDCWSAARRPMNREHATVPRPPVSGERSTSGCTSSTMSARCPSSNNRAVLLCFYLTQDERHLEPGCWTDVFRRAAPRGARVGRHCASHRADRTLPRLRVTRSSSSTSSGSLERPQRRRPLANHVQRENQESFERRPARPAIPSRQPFG